MEPGGSAVSMPAEAQYRSSQIESPVGPITEHRYSSSGGGADFTLVYSDLPAVALLFEGRDAIYGRAAKELLEANRAQERSRRAFELGGRPGVELEYTADGRLGKARFLLETRRLFVLEANWPSAAQVDSGRFFGTFRVTGKG